jgi:hypothetical protein
VAKTVTEPLAVASGCQTQTNAEVLMVEVHLDHIGDRVNVVCANVESPSHLRIVHVSRMAFSTAALCLEYSFAGPSASERTPNPGIRVLSGLRAATVSHRLWLPM